MSDLGQNGVIPVVPPAQLESRLQKQAQDKAAAAQPAQQNLSDLAGFIRAQYEIFRNHRNTQNGWSDRLLNALRAFNGQYDPTTLQQIKQFGGSEIYARLISQKCRAASSLLRDIYIGQDRPWAVQPPSDPTIPIQITQSITSLMQQEAAMVAQHKGQPPNQSDVDERKRTLLEAARDAAKKKAAEQARISEDKIEDILRSGGFYTALAEFIVDLPIFPFAVVKGPVVKVIPTLQWPPQGGQPTKVNKPTLTWNRVSPFDLWWTPGVADIANANTIERMRVTRAELNDLLDLPGYNQSEITAVLDEYGRGGLYDNWDSTDAERAVLESRENPAWNRSGLIAMLEFNGNVQGRMLQDYGLAVPDEMRDYYVQAWLIGTHVIKAQIAPSPRQRHPYFITSFEKVPGTPVGNGLTDLLTDVQDVANATMRAIVNNISIASGPQVVINDDKVSMDENTEDLYPWKRWHTRNDPASVGAGQKPVDFFMPTMNAQQLIAVYEKFVSVADDVSAIPKYVGGSADGSGAGRTASGLAMLMGNASKILQNVAANIDRDILEQALEQLTDLILLTDTSGLLTGEEKVVVRGVTVAIQRETMRQRQLEFLQTTNNPTDMKIMGIKGRAEVLRPVSNTIGLDGERIVPSDDQLDQMEQQEKQSQQSGPMQQMVEQGVQSGVKAGVTRIATELTAGLLAQNSHMPEGMPVHIGTLPQGGAPPQGGPPQGGPPQGGLQNAARMAQGTRQSPVSTNHTGPVTALVGNQPQGPRPIRGGVG